MVEYYKHEGSNRVHSKMGCVIKVHNGKVDGITRYDSLEEAIEDGGNACNTCIGSSRVQINGRRVPKSDEIAPRHECPRCGESTSPIRGDDDAKVYTTVAVEEHKILENTEMGGVVAMGCVCPTCNKAWVI